MSAGLALVLLAAMLLALLPVWRLARAGWRPGILFGAWVVYAAALAIAIRVPGPSRFLLPILVLAFVAPFVAGPERLARALGRKVPRPRPVIDVTPRPGPELREPTGDVSPDDEDRDRIG